MNSLDYQILLFKQLKRIFQFFSFLEMKYKLSDIPYNVAGKEFPRMGTETISGVETKYRFHGRGCTIYWEGNIETIFSIDTTSIHQIMINSGDVEVFLNSYFKDFDKKFSNHCIDNWMIEMERIGVFMKRKPSDSWRFHINMEWYRSIESGNEFIDSNSNQIDWS